MSSDPRSSYDWCGAWGPMGPWMAPWMQMTRMWMDTLRPFIPMPPDPGSCADPWTQASAWGYGAGRRRPRLAVTVSSRRPTEVVVDLAPGAEAANLDPTRLRDKEGNTLEVTEIRCEEGQLRVRVTVPDTVPEGRYSGELYDSRCCKQGEIVVTVHGSDGENRNRG